MSLPFFASLCLYSLDLARHPVSSKHIKVGIRFSSSGGGTVRIEAGGAGRL